MRLCGAGRAKQDEVALGEQRKERDREQVSVYCRRIAEMTGRPCRGLLWYIDADNDIAIDVI